MTSSAAVKTASRMRYPLAARDSHTTGSGRCIAAARVASARNMHDHVPAMPRRRRTQHNIQRHRALAGC